MCASSALHQQATSVIVFLGQFGSLVAFLVVLVGLAVPVFQAHGWLGGLSAVVLRAVIAFGLCVGLLFPLSMFRQIHKLALPAVLAILAVLWTAAVITMTGAQDVPALTELEATRGDADWLGAIPIVVFGFNCHQQAVPVHGGTAANSRPSTRGWVLAAAILFCFVVYVTTAVAGYAAFGNATNGNILLSCAAGHRCDEGHRRFQDSPLVDSAKLVMAAHIALAYPVVLFPCLRAMDSCAALSTPRSEAVGLAGSLNGEMLHLLGEGEGGPARKRYRLSGAATAMYAHPHATFWCLADARACKKEKHPWRLQRRFAWVCACGCARVCCGGGTCM